MKAADEDLVLGAQPGQVGQGEVALDGDIALGQPHPLDGEGASLGEPRQRLPVLGFRHLRSTESYIQEYGIINFNFQGHENEVY